MSFQKSRYIGSRGFYSHVLAVAVPIAIQNGITNFVGMLDNIMVGQVGTDQMSGVSIVNQLLFVYNLMIFGGLAGIGIFTAQFSGKGDEKGVRYTMRLKLVLALVLTHFWYCGFLMRARLSEEVSKDYVLLCKGKGLTENQVIWRHCIKNIMPSALSIMAIFLPHLLGGAYVVEMVFSYPGLGKLGMESAQYHDYNLLMIIVLITGTVVILANMIAQSISEGLDPRIKEERGQMI